MSRRRRRTHRGLWLTAPDELSLGRLVRLHWECDGDVVLRHTDSLFAQFLDICGIMHVNWQWSVQDACYVLHTELGCTFPDVAVS